MVSLLPILTTACHDEDPAKTETVCTLEAAPAVPAPLGGDANGDGYVDVSDGAYLARHAMAGGPAPVCLPGVDLVPDGALNLGDVVAVWYSVGSRTAPYRPEVDAEDCPTVTRTATPPCGDGLAFGVDAPAQVTGPEGGDAAVTASITLTSPTLPVEAWSFTLTAAGCTLDGGTTAGTDAADVADGTGGLRVRGVAWQSVLPAEAQVLTVLDWRNQGVLPTGGARVVHTFTAHGTAVSGCGTCTLTLSAGDPVSGVESVVSAEGWRYVPALASKTVEICPG